MNKPLTDGEVEICRTGLQGVGGIEANQVLLAGGRAYAKAWKLEFTEYIYKIIN